MRQPRINIVAIVLILIITSVLRANNQQTLQKYVDVLSQKGKDPVRFVLDTFNQYDLILFDDGLHTTVEPFEFYEQLVQLPEFHNKVKYVFIEVIPMNKQPHIDTYFNTTPEDITLLFPAFQDDLGWAYQTYYDLFHTVYETNQKLDKKERIKVIGVSSPSYWSEINTPEDWSIYRDKALLSRDYTIYLHILSELDQFSSGKKGVFLTNTRHAYTSIKKRNGQFAWNCGTFFHQWHPGKTYSIRAHNVMLHISMKKKRDNKDAKTAEGLEEFDIRWVRMGNGLWDSAFALYGNKPIAIELKNTPFGKEPYIGNLMLTAAPGQTMQDAYDAVMFLAPLEKLHKTAKVDMIYTPQYKKEIARRYSIMRTSDQLKKEMQQAGVETLYQLIDKKFVAEPESLLPESQTLNPIDAWKKKLTP